jgi:hypothetical protein
MRIKMDSTVQVRASADHWEPEEDWQARVERLQEWVCRLLTKNQILREALHAERTTGQRGDSSSESSPSETA